MKYVRAALSDGRKDVLLVLNLREIFFKNSMPIGGKTAVKTSVA